MAKSTHPILLALTTILFVSTLALGGCARLKRGSIELTQNGRWATEQQPAAQLPTIQPTVTLPAQELKPSATSQPEQATQPASSPAVEDPGLDAVDQMLNDLQNTLNTADTVSDFQ